MRQEGPGGDKKATKITIIDLQNPSGIETHGINADSAILNPMTEIIALKGLLTALSTSIHSDIFDPRGHLVVTLDSFFSRCSTADTASGQVLQIFNLKMKVNPLPQRGPRWLGSF